MTHLIHVHLCHVTQFRQISNRLELLEFIDKDQLTLEFDGDFAYNHQEWVRFRMVSIIIAIAECVLRMRLFVYMYVQVHAAASTRVCV